jgi:hypothetical protein
MTLDHDATTILTAEQASRSGPLIRGRRGSGSPTPGWPARSTKVSPSTRPPWPGKSAWRPGWRMTWCGCCAASGTATLPWLSCGRG